MEFLSFAKTNILRCARCYRVDEVFFERLYACLSSIKIQLIKKPKIGLDNNGLYRRWTENR